MAAVHDVAAYILGCRGEMTILKLHLLLYYSQAWSLVWDERPLFEEPIEARPHGPVVSSLPAGPGSPFKISAWPEGDPAALTSTERETIDAVLHFYGSKSTPWLGELARGEQPWRTTRAQVLLLEPHPEILFIAFLRQRFYVKQPPPAPPPVPPARSPHRGHPARIAPGSRSCGDPVELSGAGLARNRRN